MKTKRFIVFCVAIVCLIAQFSAPVMAEENDIVSGVAELFYFDDGSYITVSPIVVVEESRQTRATAATKTGTRTVTFTDSSGNTDWKYTLTATFSYVSCTSSTCTSASYTKNIYDTSWEFSTGSATKSGNVATGKGTFKDKVLFVTTQTQNINVTITCDTYGNLT